MSLIAPKLDDRHFQDIVDEARKRIPHYCPQWTDFNVSDPGITLVELFAWMTDIILYRMNRVPDLHLIKFMQMLGVTLQEPQPAHAPVTFWLSAPQELALTIPAGTEVASTQTEFERSVVFTTDVDLQIRPPQLESVLAHSSRAEGTAKRFQEQNLRRLTGGLEEDDGIDLFNPVQPQVDDAFYFGFAHDLSHHILGFDFDFSARRGRGIDPALPPLAWEASTGTQGEWRGCAVDFDSTQGMNSVGRIRIHLPRMGSQAVEKRHLFWVRVRVRAIGDAEAADGMRPYDLSPRLRRLGVGSWGGTTPATHSHQMSREYLGRSDGSAGQRYQLQVTPILPRRPGETLVVQIDGRPPEMWVERPDFADSGPDDNHFTLDGITGELRLGAAIRQPNGEVRLYGAIPPRGANLYFDRYRVGGGLEGNVQAGFLNTLKTAIPFVARVANRERATGGVNAESLEAAMMRVPATLRTRDRAVTPADFEFLAQQALPGAIGRVNCRQTIKDDHAASTAGRVFVLVIPRVMNAEGYIEPEKLEFNEADKAILTAYLDERRVLTARLDVRQPAYQWTAVKVTLGVASDADKAVVEREALLRLYRYLNPLVGGPDGRGWPFGRDLFVSDVYQCLLGLPNVLFLRNVEIFAAQPGGGARGDPLDQMEVLTHGVIASGIHEIRFD